MAKKKKRAIPEAMKPWLKFGPGCQKESGVKPFKKQTAAQKKKVELCVMRNARLARMKIAGK